MRPCDGHLARVDIKTEMQCDEGHKGVPLVGAQTTLARIVPRETKQ
jgi:hypothetical protein